MNSTNDLTSKKYLNQVCLSEIAEIIDSLHSTPTYSDDGYPMVRVTDISDYYLDTRSCLKVDKNVYEEFTRRKIPVVGDIIFTRVGSYGNASQIINHEQICLGQNTALIHPLVDPNYLFFCLKSKFVRKQIESLVVGSTQKTISIKSIKELKIPIFSEQENNCISEILTRFQSKIELNRKTNETLEGIAKALFKSWFIDFDPVKAKAEGRSIELTVEISELFPGSSEDSELGEIPSGWQCKSLREIADFQNGYAFKSKEYIDKNETSMEVLRMGYIDRGGGFKEDNSPVFIATCSKGYQEKYLIQKNDLTIAMTDMKDKMVILGCCALIEDNKRFVLNQRVGRIRVIDSEVVDPRYLYIYMNHPTHIDLIRSKSNSGVQVNLSTDVIKNTSILIPDKSIMKDFKTLSEKLFSQIFNNNKEIKILVQVRNTLLPKLISGELRIPDAEKMLEEVAI